MTVCTRGRERRSHRTGRLPVLRSVRVSVPVYTRFSVFDAVGTYYYYYYYNTVSPAR